MVDIPAPLLLSMFEGHPDALAILRGDTIVSANAALRAQIGVASSLSACIEAADHEGAARALQAGECATFTAHLARGEGQGAAMRWTIWPLGDGHACVRLDGPLAQLEGFSAPLSANAQIHQARTLLEAMGHLPLAVWAMEADGTCSLSMGEAVRDFGMEPGALVGHNLFEVYAGQPDVLDELRRALAGERFVNEAALGEVRFRNHYIPTRHAPGGEVTRVFAVAENVTERRAIERRLEEQLLLIQAQKRAIAGLSSPIIEVWQGILIVPVIGHLDEERAGRVLERLLAEVVARQSRSVILDLTGVDSVDAATALHLFNIMRSVELLGAKGVLTGIGPGVARAMVELGVELSTRRTYPTLAEALRRLIGERA